MDLHNYERVGELREALGKIDNAIRHLQPEGRTRAWWGPDTVSVTAGGGYFGFDLPMPPITREQALARAEELRAELVAKLTDLGVTVNPPPPEQDDLQGLSVATAAVVQR